MSSFSNAYQVLNNSNYDVPGDNEFFKNREQDNMKLMMRNFIIARPEVYNMMPPENTQLNKNRNKNEHLLKYPGIDRRSKQYWTNYLKKKNIKTGGVPTNDSINYSDEQPNEQQNEEPYIAGININIEDSNSLNRLGMLSKLDTIPKAEYIALNNNLIMHEKYFTISDTMKNSDLMYRNMTRAVNTDSELRHNN